MHNTPKWHYPTEEGVLSATGTDQAIDPPQPPGEARGEKSTAHVLRAVKIRGVSLLRAGLGVWGWWLLPGWSALTRPRCIPPIYTLGMDLGANENHSQ